MSRTAKGQGTKIAQAAKQLNVTSVTIRRYISEFEIETTADENGIKVLPPQAMEELHEIRKLKEDGLTNPKVMELLEERRSKPEKAEKGKGKDKEKEKKVEKKAPPVRRTKAKIEEDEDEEEVEEEAEEEEVPAAKEKPTPPPRASRQKSDSTDGGSTATQEEAPAAGGELEEGRSKHVLTCQTCSKTFEHMNPRLRDCLECYRAKRKERRRGGDKQRNVIQHPLAQQVANKAQQAQQRGGDRTGGGDEPTPAAAATAAPAAAPQPVRASSVISVAPATQRTAVRNYRKAIEETRTITSNLKRRLERPDLPEGERRWLEQIYAYQLILHQGWRHLSEYKAGTLQQKGAQHDDRDRDRDRDR